MSAAHKQKAFVEAGGLIAAQGGAAVGEAAEIGERDHGDARLDIKPPHCVGAEQGDVRQFLRRSAVC